MKKRKKAGYDLRKSYPLFLEAGLIAALLLMIMAVKVTMQDEPPAPPPVAEQDVVEMEEVIQTQQQKTPPPPPRPQVPVEVPNDEVLEDEIVDLDAELDLDAKMDMPPPPPDSDDEDDDRIFVVVEEDPAPVGGVNAIYDKIEYPKVALQAGIEGKVFLQFLVTKEGKVENIEVLRSLHPLCDKEAVEAVKATKFKPGRQRGRPVAVRFSLSISFRIQ